LPIVDRSRITDAQGRRIPVTRTTIPGRGKLETKRPERFHEERSEIARELQKLAEALKD